MKPIQIIFHTPGNTLGELESVLSERKLPFNYISCHELAERHIHATETDGLVILGGYESAADDDKHTFMPPEKLMIRNAIANNLPVFGICLGSQMLARSLGAVVERNKVNGREVKEVGWTPLALSDEGQRDPVLSKLDGFAQFQWHEDTFHLPPGAVHLASSERCPQQAFKLDKPGSPVYGVQFHPEVTPKGIAAWLKSSKSLSKEEKTSIWEETEKYYPVRHQASRRMFEAFCEQSF